MSLALFFFLGLAACSQAAKQESPSTTSEPQKTETLKVASEDKDNEVPLAEFKALVKETHHRVYGHNKGTSWGLYGALKACERRLASRRMGGTGLLTWAEPQNLVFEAEETLHRLAPESEQARFQLYQEILSAQEKRLRSQLDQCKKETSLRELDLRQSAKVMINEADKMSLERHQLNAFMCSYVKEAGTLRSLVKTLLSKGWMDLSSLRFEENLLSDRIEDQKGVARANAFTQVGGWVLSYDKDELLTYELLSGQKDSRLKAWIYRGDGSKGSESCLKQGSGQWHQALRD